MRSLANAAHAIEGRDADASGEISVGAAAYSRFFQLPFNLLRNCLCLFVERGDTGIPLHGQTVHATIDAERAVLVERLQRAEFAIERGRLLGEFDSHIDFYRRLCCDYIGASAAAN